MQASVLTRYAALCFALLAAATANAEAPDAQLRWRIDSATITRDPSEIAACLKRLGSSDAATQRSTLRAVALLHAAAATSANWKPDLALAELRRHVAESLRVLDILVGSEDTSADDHLLKAAMHFQEAMIDQQRIPELMPRIQEAVASASEMEPENPHLVYLHSVLALTGQAPTPQLIDSMEAAARGIARRVAKQGGRADWWDMQIYNLLCLTHTFYLGDPERGARWAQAGLQLRPDCQLLAQLQEPHARAYEATDAAELVELQFEQLASDAAGDQMAYAGADCIAAARAWDEDGRVWFRFRMASWAPEGRIGVNVVVDVDDDPASGMPWWGEHKNFHFDRLASLWVRRADDGKYYGVNGVTDANGASGNRMLDLGVGDFEFAIDEVGGFLYVGIEASALAEVGEVRALFAVGSNQAWGDDVAAAEGKPIRLSLAR